MAVAPATQAAPTTISQLNPAPVPQPTPTPVPNGGVADAPVARRKRAPGGKRIARPVTAYFVLQILDESGAPIQFNKKRIKILACERSTDKVLDIIDGGEFENALYIRGQLPPGRASTVAA